MRIEMEPPNEKQREFFMATAKYIAYGGARGGGKSWAVRKKAQLMALKYGGIKILIMRRTYPELVQNHIQPLLEDLNGVARFKETDKTFYFANGSKIIFGYCDSERDVNRYQGNEYDVIFMDEATHFTEYMFDTLKVCIRGTNGFPKRFYLTCNPGGVGHEWVKRLFITGDYRKGEDEKDYRFIKATVYDNTKLMETNGDYVQQLENLPDDLRKAWLDGSWDLFIGQYFPEFDRDIHVCQPFTIPVHWTRYRVFDYGLDMLACYWIAVDEQGRAFVYDELYESNLIVSAAAEKILAKNSDLVMCTYAPPDMWNRVQDSGKSKAEIFYENGVPLVKAKNDRITGWMNVKEWLKQVSDEYGKVSANLKICSNCINLIRCLPAVQRDAKNINDVAKEPHELTHSVDALRYFCAGRPIPAAVPVIRDEDDVTYDEGLDNLLQYGG